MSQNNRLYQVQILIEQSKYAEAEKVLKDLLATDSDNTDLLALLAEVNLQQNKLEIAKQLVDNAIGLAPAEAHLFYIKSRIYIQEDKYSQAEEQIDQAIALDPEDADYFAMLANIKIVRKQFEQALEVADHALELDPENLLALNSRSTALNKLNRKEESYQTIEGALREDPNNPYTHANFGWGLLEKGDHKKALEHFGESLKNNPDSPYAQAGMLEAIKASNPIYRMFLKYSFWMSNLTAKYQWGVIIGFYVGFRILRTIVQKNEALQPYLNPLIIALAILAFSTWIIGPVSNLFLRFNKYGQLLLDKKEKLSSNLVAVSLGLFVIGAILYFVLSDVKYLTIAVFGFAMSLPFGSMFAPSKNKNALIIYAIVMCLVGLIAIATTFSTGELMNAASSIFLLGFIGFQWVANFLMIRETNH